MHSFPPVEPLGERFWQLSLGVAGAETLVIPGMAVEQPAAVAADAEVVLRAWPQLLDAKDVALVRELSRASLRFY